MEEDFCRLSTLSQTFDTLSDKITVVWSKDLWFDSTFCSLSEMSFMLDCTLKLFSSSLDNLSDSTMMFWLFNVSIFEILSDNSLMLLQSFVWFVSHLLNLSEIHVLVSLDCKTLVASSEFSYLSVSVCIPAFTPHVNWFTLLPSSMMLLATVAIQFWNRSLETKCSDGFVVAILSTID